MHIIKTHFIKKYFPFLTIFCCFSCNVYAQSVSDTIAIEGKTVDQEKKYLPATTIMLLNKDSLLLKTTMADDSGYFKFANIKRDRYIIKASLIGHNDDVYRFEGLDTSRNKSILMILKPAQNLLKEVVINAKNLPLIEKRLDKLIFNVENSGLNVGNSAFEILQRSPGVSIDDNGNVSLNGQQGVTVLINDKPTYLSQAQLTAYLKSLRGEDISRIEIMANPSSKYDAAGSAILNIKTKVNNKKGFNGNLYAIHSQSKFVSNYGGVSISYKNDRINASIGYNGGVEKYWNSNESSSDFASSNTVIKTNSYGEYRSLRNNIKSNLAYELSNNHSMVLSTTHLINTYKTLGFLSTNDFYSSTNNVDSASTTSNTGISDFNSNQYSLFYYGILDTLGSKLSAGLDYSIFKSPTDQQIITDFVSYFDNSRRQKTIINYNPVNNNIRAFKIDYTRVFKNKAQLELGIKASKVKLNNENIFVNTYGSVSIPDDLNSNNFNYQERIFATYVNFNISVSRKISIQSGLRVENTFNEGGQAKRDSLFRNQYLNFFPSVVIQNNLDKNNTLSVTYSRRISRPQYEFLNPFKYIINDFSYRVGNPNLRPEIINSFELSHVFKHKIITTLFYKSTSDVISTLVTQNNITKLTVSTYDNINSARNIGSSVTGSISIGESLFVQTSVSVYNNRFMGVVNNLPLNVNATSFSVSQYLQVSLPKKYNLDFNWNYQSKKSLGLYEVRPLFFINASLKKRIFTNMDLGLNFNDIFNTLESRSSINQNQVNAIYKNKSQSQKLNISLNYSFGNSKLKVLKKDASGIDTEKDRSIK